MNAIEELWNMARDAAREAWDDMMRTQLFDMYLYYRPGELKAFHQEIGTHTLAGWSLAWAQRVPCNLDKEQLTRWIADKCRSVPCLKIA
jgi:hypothetical protein